MKNLLSTHIIYSTPKQIISGCSVFKRTQTASVTCRHSSFKMAPRATAMCRYSALKRPPTATVMCKYLRWHGPLKWRLTAGFYGPVNRPNTFSFFLGIATVRSVWSTYVHVEGNFFNNISCRLHRPVVEFLSDCLEFFWARWVSEQRLNACCVVVTVLCARCAVDCTLCGGVEWQCSFAVRAEILGSHF